MAIDYPEMRVAASKRSEENMESTKWFRVILMGILIGSLGVPPGETATRARQGQGPQTPPPPESTVPPRPPGGQQKPPQQQAPEPPPVSISVESNVVNIDAVVTDEAGDVLGGLTRENFRILDN